MIQNVTFQTPPQGFVQLYSSAPRDLSFLRSFISSFEWLDWDPSQGIYAYFLELNADLAITKTAHLVSRYAYRFLEPGIMLLDSKRRLGCELPKDANSLKKFLSAERLSQMKKLIADVEQSLDFKTAAEINAKAAKSTLGCRVIIDSKIGVYFDMMLPEFTHFRNAIDYLQESFTSIENFWNQTDEKSLNVLLKAHCELSGRISYVRGKDWMVIPEEIVNGEKGYNFQKLAEENNLSEKDRCILTTLERSGRLHNRKEYTSEEERVMNLIAFLPTKVTEIMPSMVDFVGKLKKQYEIMQKLGNVNYIRLASFAHQRIRAIHPFENDNDRFARALVTVLLVQGGYDPVVFHNNEEYMLEIRTGRKDLKSFERYLERCIQMTAGLQDELALLI